MCDCSDKIWLTCLITSSAWICLFCFWSFIMRHFTAQVTRQPEILEKIQMSADVYDLDLKDDYSLVVTQSPVATTNGASTTCPLDNLNSSIANQAQATPLPNTNSTHDQSITLKNIASIPQLPSTDASHNVPIKPKDKEKAINLTNIAQSVIPNQNINSSVNINSSTIVVKETGNAIINDTDEIIKTQETAIVNNQMLGGDTADLNANTTPPSVTATNTMISHVSSIGDPFIMDDVLIVILGIGEYDSGLHNLPGVRKDYNNIIHTFVKYWKYKVLYKTNDMNVVYSNDINFIDQNRNYKLYWTRKDIQLFVEQARQYVVRNKHSGLIFVISSHGDTDKVIYDSEKNEYRLGDIFNLFTPQWSLLLELYKETQDESNHLFQIPKIFCIDSCRGSAKAQLTNVNPAENAAKMVVDATLNCKQIGADLDVQQTDDVEPSPTMVPIIIDDETKQDEKFELKTISKDESKANLAQRANFCKLWANVEGCSVADGNQNGGLFLRNVAKLFKDKGFITRHEWSDIIIKIREKTKREASLIGIFNFTQLVEDESTLEKPIIFSRYGLPSNSNAQSNHDNNSNSNNNNASTPLGPEYTKLKGNRSLLNVIREGTASPDDSLQIGIHRLGSLDVTVPLDGNHNPNRLKQRSYTSTNTHTSNSLRSKITQNSNLRAATMRSVTSITTAPNENDDENRNENEYVKGCYISDSPMSELTEITVPKTVSSASDDNISIAIDFISSKGADINNNNNTNTNVNFYGNDTWLENNINPKDDTTPINNMPIENKNNDRVESIAGTTDNMSLKKYTDENKKKTNDNLNGEQLVMDEKSINKQLPVAISAKRVRFDGQSTIDIDSTHQPPSNFPQHHDQGLHNQHNIQSPRKQVQHDDQSLNHGKIVVGPPPHRLNVQIPNADDTLNDHEAPKAKDGDYIDETNGSG